MFKTTLMIEGMACGMCENHINSSIRENFSINRINTSHSKGNSIILSNKPLDKEKLTKVMTNMGYTLTSYQVELY